MFKTKAIPILLVSWLIAFCGAYACGQSPSAAPSVSAADESCKKEFDAICSRTEDAMVFSPEELTALVKRCDALKPKIEKLDDTQKKVYMRRLAQCRGLFAYVLDSKRNEKN